MHQSDGPKSGLEEDMVKAQKQAKPAAPVRAKRTGGAVEMYDGQGNLTGVMRARDFDSIKEDLGK